jgi:hypothetical protein
MSLVDIPALQYAETVEDLRRTVEFSFARVINQINNTVVDRPFDMNNNRVRGVKRPIAQHDAVNLAYLEEQLGDLRKRAVRAVVEEGGGGTDTGDTWVRTIGSDPNANLQVAVDVAPHLIIPFAATLEKVFYKVKIACTGASIIVNPKQNGSVVVFSSGNRPTIPVSDTTVKNQTNMSVTAFAEGDYLTLDVDQIGSIVTGSSFVITFRFRVN